MISSGVRRASLWTGGASTYFDLHKFAKGYSWSVASGTWDDGSYVYVAGWGYNAKARRVEALLWRRRK